MQAFEKTEVEHLIQAFRETKQHIEALPTIVARVVRDDEPLPSESHSKKIYLVRHGDYMHAAERPTFAVYRPGRSQCGSEGVERGWQPR